MNETRRNFLKQLGIAASVSSLPISLKASSFTLKEKKMDTAFDFVVQPYLQDLKATSVSIFTVVNEKAFTWIELIDERQQVRLVYEVEEGLRKANTLLSRISVSDLQPDTVYSYRVLSKKIVQFDPYKIVFGKEIATAKKTFRTNALKRKDTVNCCVFNDIHEETTSYAHLLALINKEDLDFVVNNGDAVHHLSKPEDFEVKCLAPLSLLLEGRIPMVINRGNHETRGAYAFDYGNYVRHDTRHYYHSFTEGNVFWIYLDSGEDKPDDHEVYAGLSDYDAYRVEQSRWLAAVMESEAYKQAKFKVVVMHIPPYHSDDWHGTLHCRAQFSPLFDKNGVDLVVSGHTHSYGHYPPDKDHRYALLIGGGPKVGKRTLIHLQGAGNTLTYQMIRDDGHVIAKETLKK